MKKLFALLMALLMVVSMTSFAVADEPTKVVFWHSMGSGANYEAVKEIVDNFNATIGTEKNIFVEEVYIGGYAVLQSKVQMASASGEQPTVSVTSGVRNGILMDDGLTEDMAPYIAASTDFDASRFFDSLLYTAGNEDGAIYSLPFVRSTPLFFYNKTLADSKGLTEAPTTIEELVEFASKLHTVGDDGEVKTWGFEMSVDITYLQGSFLYQQGSSLAGGGTAACLSDGTMEKFLTDWLSWIDAGWCRTPTKEALGDVERLSQGMLGSFVGSCSKLGNLVPACKELGIELGVAYFPVYDAANPACSIGGGNVVLIADNTDEVKQAGWEFISYMLRDENIAKIAIKTGYLPTTKTLIESAEMQQYWAENPGFKLAYDQLVWGICEETPFWPDLTEYKTNISNVVDSLVKERNMTVQEAIEQMKVNNAHLL